MTRSRSPTKRDDAANILAAHEEIRGTIQLQTIGGAVAKGDAAMLGGVLRPSAETFRTTWHHGDMRSPGFAILLLLCSLASADIIDDVRGALAQRNFAAADSQLQTYRAQHGVDPAYLEALSWMARARIARS